MPAEAALQLTGRPEAAAGEVFLNGTTEGTSALRIVLRKYFDAMSRELGPMHWWPAKSAFEVIVGAILTQNTAWTNVKLALVNLRREKLLTPRAIARVPGTRLEKLIRSSGYYRQKAKKLKAFVAFLASEYRGSLKRMAAAPTAKLREQLLAVHGIGPETADSILLYAAEHPVFVVDAYTKRILARHGIVSEGAKYEDVQAIFVKHVPSDAKIFNEYHALIVEVGKRWCGAREARCEECPLGEFLPGKHVPIHAISARPAIEVRP